MACTSTTLRWEDSRPPKTLLEQLLFSPDPTGFITGEALSVNGGAFMD